MRHLSIQRACVQPLQRRRAPTPTVVTRTCRITCGMVGRGRMPVVTTRSTERMIGGHTHEQATRAVQEMVRQSTRMLDASLLAALMMDGMCAPTGRRGGRRTTTCAW